MLAIFSNVIIYYIYILLTLSTHTDPVYLFDVSLTSKEIQRTQHTAQNTEREQADEFKGEAWEDNKGRQVESIHNIKRNGNE